MKLPWMKFFFQDLDRDCRALSLSARGAWVWIFGDLHYHEGERTLSLDAWARVVSASISQTADVLAEIIRAGVCDSNYTADALPKNTDAQIMIRCRRIAKEYRSRKLHNLRQQKYKRESNADARADAEMTAQMSEAKKTEAKKLATLASESAREEPNYFVDVLAEYPAHRRGTENMAYDAWARLKPDLELQKRIMRGIIAWKRSDEWIRERGRYVPSFANFIDSRRWEGAPSERSIESDELPPEPAGSDPMPPKGMEWLRDDEGNLMHPIRAVPKGWRGNQHAKAG